jgi:hypothetical protein
MRKVSLDSKSGDVRISAILKLVRVTFVLRGKAIRITHSKCMSVALVTRHAKTHAPYYNVMRGQSGCTIFFHSISLMARFSEKKFMNRKYVF